MYTKCMYVLPNLCNKFEHNQFSRSQDIEAGYARDHVHSDTPWAY